MKIGMLLPATYAIGNPFNGVREQALSQASSLELLGHEVIHLSPWVKYELDSLDVLQYFFGGHWMNGIETMASPTNTVRVFAPIVDTVQSTSSYRWAARLGSMQQSRME